MKATVPTTQYLRVVDFLEVAERVLRARQEEICTEEVVELARYALEAPAAERRGPTGAQRELYPGIAVKAGVMCTRLLTEPPCIDEAAKIAYGCLESFLLRNGAEWLEEPQVTVLRFNRVRGNVADAEDLGSWIAMRISEGDPRVATGENLFNGIDKAPNVVYLAGPVKGLPENQADQLEAIRKSVESGLAAVREATGSKIEIRLEHPSTHLSESAAPDVSDDEVWEYSSRQLAESVDALIIVDVALQSAGFGATSEFDLHCQQDGPILYLRHAGEKASRFLTGRSQEVDVEILAYTDAAELAEVIRDWMLERWHAVQGAARRRGDRQLQYAPLKARLQKVWSEAPEPRRELAANAAGMTIAAVNRVLTSVAMLAMLPAHSLDALCRELAITSSRTHREPGRIDAQAPPDYKLLLQLATEQRWPGSAISAVFDAVKHSDRARPYASRSRYTDKPAFEKLRRELGV